MMNPSDLFFLRLPDNIILHPLLDEIFGEPEEGETRRLNTLARAAGVWGDDMKNPIEEKTSNNA